MYILKFIFVFVELTCGLYGFNQTRWMINLLFETITTWRKKLQQAKKIGLFTTNTTIVVGYKLLNQNKHHDGFQLYALKFICVFF